MKDGAQNVVYGIRPESAPPKSGFAVSESYLLFGGGKFEGLPHIETQIATRQNPTVPMRKFACPRSRVGQKKTLPPTRVSPPSFLVKVRSDTVREIFSDTEISVLTKI